MKMKPLFLMSALWGFGAALFAAGSARYWEALAAGFLAILALLGAVTAEFAEEYTRRGSRGVAASRRIDAMDEHLAEVHEDLHAVSDKMTEILGYLERMAEANAMLHPGVQYEDRPVVKPMAPLPLRGSRG